MFTCKNCHEKLTKFDKDICPYCGTKNPILDDEDSSDTTKTIDIIKENDKSLMKHNNLVFNLLLMFLGMFSIDLFYIKKIKNALIRLLVNVLFFVILFLIIYLINNELLILSLVLPFSVLFVFYFILGLISLISGKRIKDFNGVYLR